MIPRPATLARNAMVVSAHPLASEAGIAALRLGGHAVDAAIASALTLAVVEPWASGLGGDSFLLVHEAGTSSNHALNGSGRAPAALRPDRVDAGQLEEGATSPTVPGSLRALADAHARWGRLAWRDLFASAHALATEGFAISGRMARMIRLHHGRLAADPGLRAAYLRADGSLPLAGQVCRPAALARTIGAIAEGGADVFYRGEVGAALVAGLRTAGGFLDRADLHAHQGEIRHPITHDFTAPDVGNLTLLEQPLPSQGILLPLMLGITARAARENEPAWLELHREIEAKRIAFALRDLMLTDPEALPLPEEELVAALLDEETLAALAALLAHEPLPQGLEVEVAREAFAQARPANRRILDVYQSAGFGGARGSDTTYLAAADREGNLAGLITSIFHSWGSGFLEPTTGILLNNRAAGFSLDPGHPNRLAPGKRTLHTLNSWILAREGRPWIIGGTPGGDAQVQTNLQLLRHLLHGDVCWPGPLPMEEGRWTQKRRLDPARGRRGEPELLPIALEAPRWSHDRDLRIESRMAAEIRRRLARIGHGIVRIGPWDGSGNAQMIAVMETPGARVYCGASDPRGEGVALGI